MSDDEQDDNILMPFVVVASVGGPFHDESYAAGWEVAKIDSELAVSELVGATPGNRTVLRNNLPQLDLVAMLHRFIMTVNYEDVEGTWVGVSFSHNDE